MNTYEHWEGVNVHSFSPTISSFNLSFSRPLCNPLIQHGDECSQPITREQYHPENQCNTRCGWLLRQWSYKPAKLAQQMEMVDCDSHILSIGWTVSAQWVLRPFLFVFFANNTPHRTVNYAPSSQYLSLFRYSQISIQQMSCTAPSSFRYGNWGKLFPLCFGAPFPSSTVDAGFSISPTSSSWSSLPGQHWVPTSRCSSHFGFSVVLRRHVHQ